MIDFKLIEKYFYINVIGKFITHNNKMGNKFPDYAGTLNRHNVFFFKFDEFFYFIIVAFRQSLNFFFFFLTNVF